jgi:anti-sigma regulatory factor (Ser/Thr protein kinase)
MTRAGPAREGGAEARHALLVYDSADSLRARAVPYLRASLDHGETVIAVVAADVQQLLRAALGDEAARVHWQLDTVAYARLGAMFEGARRFFAEQRAAGVAMRLLAQNDTAGSPHRMAAYLRFEAMANEVLGAFGYPWACLYDTRAHTPQMLRGAHQTHPRLLDHHGHEVPNADYLDPATYLARSVSPPPPPAAVQLDLTMTSPAELAEVRRRLRRWAQLHTSDDRDADDVLIAAGEAVTNALRHGVPPVRVRAETADDQARVHVHDRGLSPIPATAGYHRPTPDLDHGYGLWIARQLADTITTHTDLTGTTIALDFPSPTGQAQRLPAEETPMIDDG